MAGKLITERVGVNGDVSFLVRIREGGVKVSKTFKAKKDAEKFIREVKSKIDKGESVDITKIKKLTLEAIFTEYLKHNTVAEGKRYDLERLKTEIGKVPLAAFKAGTFALYLKTKLEQQVPDQAKKKKLTRFMQAIRCLIRKPGRWSRRPTAKVPFANSTMPSRRLCSGMQSIMITLLTESRLTTIRPRSLDAS